MQASDAYPILCKELEAAALLSPNELAQLAEGSPFTRTVVISGEPIDIEIAVEWEGAHAVRISGHARGPSSWHHQHCQESILIAIERTDHEG